MRISKAVMPILLLTILSAGCSAVRVPTDSCVGLKRVKVTEERLVVGSDTYKEMALNGVDLFAFPGDILTWNTAKQIKDNNDFIDENCGE